MIVLRITSGLGNQMFQYAFYTLLKEKYKDTEVLCDNMWFHNNFEGREYELEKIFGNVKGSLFEIDKASVSQIINLSGKVPNFFEGTLGDIFDKVRRYINRLLKNNKLKKRKPFILEQYGENAMDPDEFFDKVMNLDTSKDWYITGFFIEEKYYSQIIDTVRKKLVFPPLSEEWNIEYAEEINSYDSISIHVRRGDYLSDLYKDKFLVLGKDYYEAAVKHINEVVEKDSSLSGRTPNIKYFIFSDDEEFVNNEFSWLENKTIITGNSGSLSYRDMQLMSLCKYNIIANSTFSQWGALLNAHPHHITVYPKKYMNGSDNEEKTDDTWVRM